MEPYLKEIPNKHPWFTQDFNRWVRIRNLSFYPADLNKRFKKMKEDNQEELKFSSNTTVVKSKKQKEEYDLIIPNNIPSRLFPENVFFNNPIVI